jgi:hypothetical protein
MSEAEAIVETKVFFHCFYEQAFGYYKPYQTEDNLDVLVEQIDLDRTNPDASRSRKIIVDDNGVVHYCHSLKTHGQPIGPFSCDPAKHKLLAPYTFFRYIDDRKVPVLMVFDYTDLRDLAREYIFIKKRFSVKNQRGDDQTV